MGDDVSQHTKEITIPDDLHFSGFMKTIIASGYLPYVSGNDVVWCLEHADSELLSYVTKPNRMFTRWCESDDPLVSDIVNCSTDNTFFFRYFSLPLRLSKYIYKSFNGNKANMWHEGLAMSMTSMTSLNLLKTYGKMKYNLH